MFGLSPRTVSMMLILVFLGYAAAQYVPAYVTALQFNDFVTEEVKFAASSQRPPEDLRRSIVDYAAELGIALDAGDIRIRRKGVNFTLELDYQLPIDLRLYRHSLSFDVSTTGETFARAND
jgi:hypothetical protein